MSNVGRMFTYRNSNWAMIMLTSEVNLVGWTGNKISSFQINTLQHYSQSAYTEVK